MLKRVSRSLVITTGVLLMAAASASATTTTFTVNDTADSALASPSNRTTCVSKTIPASCTLRAAIQAADNVGGNVDITLPSGTYTLSITASTTGTPSDDPSTGDLDIDALNSASTAPQVTITGGGADSTVINANSVGRAFTVHGDNCSCGNSSLSISGVTIEGGTPSAYSYTNDDGGGIFSEGGTLTIADSILTDNTVSTEGGAVYSDGTGLTITDSTIAGNTATTAGGGVAVPGGVVQLTNDTIDGNSSESGGGLAYLDLSSTSNGSLIDNVTVAHNNGIYGGGVYGPVYAGTIENTIIADNTNTGGSSGAGDCYGESVGDNAPDEASTADFGGNLDSDGTCFVNGVNGDRAGVDPKLATLSDSNGGSTPTDAFDADSPAISLGLAAACPATDQRGFDRLSAHCDAGAYQGDEADLAVTGTGDSVAAAGASFLETFTITNDGPYTAQGVTFSDAFPADANGAASASQGTCTGGAKISCQLGTLSAGQSVTVTANLTTLSTATIVGTGTVSASSLDGNAANNMASVSTAVGSPPALEDRPDISGYDPPVKGRTLTANAGTWTGSGVSFAYQWLSCGLDDDDGSECGPIGGATGDSYIVTSADVAKRLALEVTATNAFGSLSAYSGISGSVIDSVLQVSSTTTNGASVNLPFQCAEAAAELNPVCVLLILFSGEAVNQNALAHGKAKSKTTVYARKQVTIAAGKKVNVPVKLNHAGQVLLAKRHVLRLKLTVSEGGHVLITRSLTFRYKKPKKHKAG
jgi:CSLREA domain-containing protein